MSAICCRRSPEIHSAIRRPTSTAVAVLISTQDHYLGTQTPISLSRLSHWSLECLTETPPTSFPELLWSFWFVPAVASFVCCVYVTEASLRISSTPPDDLLKLRIFNSLCLFWHIVSLWKVPCAPQPPITDPVSHVHLSLPVNYSMVADSLAIDSEFFFCGITKEHFSGALTITLL